MLECAKGDGKEGKEREPVVPRTANTLLHCAQLGRQLI